MNFHHKLILGCATIGAAVTAGFCGFFGLAPFMVILASVAVFGGSCALGYGIDLAVHTIWGEEDDSQNSAIATLRNDQNGTPEGTPEEIINQKKSQKLERNTDDDKYSESDYVKIQNLHIISNPLQQSHEEEHNRDVYGANGKKTTELN